MNKFRFNKLTVLLICLFCLNIYGQRKEISREDFFKAYQKAEENIKKFSYRIITEGQKYRENETNLFSTGRRLEEFVPPYKTRFLWEEKVIATNEISFIETVVAEGGEYERKNNENWVKKFIRPGYILLPKQETFKPKYYLTKNVKLNNKEADLYEIQYETESVTLKPKKDKGKREKFYRKEKHWISPDGLWLRKEFNNKEFLGNGFINKQISIYEYDPNIKIEAPIIKSELRIPVKP